MGQAVPPQVFEHGGARPQTKSFAAETAAVTGESKRSINQHLSCADALGDDLDRVVGTSLDKGVELAGLRLHYRVIRLHPPLLRLPYRVMLRTAHYPVIFNELIITR